MQRSVGRLPLAALIGLAWSLAGPAGPTMAGSTPEVGLYRVFEASVENHEPYENRFADGELRCTYTAPSGREIDFIGFFDGDGEGGGDAGSGHVWKMRFMPDELGEWRYRWSWSDGTEGGSGRFLAVPEGAGKGVLRPYEENPRWFAYNGTEPVWLKSYYETGSPPTCINPWWSPATTISRSTGCSRSAASGSTTRTARTPRPRT